MQSASSADADPRLDERSNVFLSATMRVASGSMPVRIRNISNMGAMLDGASLPDEGTRVKLERGSLAADAEVAWRSGEFRGIRFDVPVNVDSWVRRVGHRGQQTVDKAVAALRIGMAAAAVTLGDASEARSLEEMSDDLLRICERISSSPNLTVEIGENLLKVESIAWSLRKMGSGTE